MRHRKVTVKLGRTAAHRKAMFRNMVTSLFENDRVTTTVAKAKALQPMADKLITLAKRGDLHSRRLALAVIRKKTVTHKLFAEIKDRYMDRAGGYTAIAKLGPRKGDGAPMAVVELIKPEEWDKTTKKKTKRKKGAKKKSAETVAQKAAAPEKTEAAAPTEEPKAAPETAQAAPAETPAEASAPEAAPAETPEEEKKSE